MTNQEYQQLYIDSINDFKKMFPKSTINEDFLKQFIETPIFFQRMKEIEEQKFLGSKEKNGKYSRHNTYNLMKFGMIPSNEKYNEMVKHNLDENTNYYQQNLSNRAYIVDTNGKSNFELYKIMDEEYSKTKIMPKYNLQGNELDSSFDFNTSKFKQDIIFEMENSKILNQKTPQEIKNNLPHRPNEIDEYNKMVVGLVPSTKEEREQQLEKAKKEYILNKQESIKLGISYDARILDEKIYKKHIETLDIKDLKKSYENYQKDIKIEKTDSLKFKDSNDTLKNIIKKIKTQKIENLNDKDINNNKNTDLYNKYILNENNNLANSKENINFLNTIETTNNIGNIKNTKIKSNKDKNITNTINSNTVKKIETNYKNIPLQYLDKEQLLAEKERLLVKHNHKLQNYTIKEIENNIANAKNEKEKSNWKEINKDKLRLGDVEKHIIQKDNPSLLKKTTPIIKTENKKEQNVKYKPDSSYVAIYSNNNRTNTIQLNYDRIKNTNKNKNSNRVMVNNKTDDEIKF